MTTKPRLIIVSPRQYGYQTDYLKYVEYLSEKYRVVFICLNQGEKKFECDKAEIKYLKLAGKRSSYLWFMIYTFVYITFHSGKVMTTNFSGCRYLKKILPWRKMVVNIRTVSVYKDSSKAAAQNERIRKDTSASPLPSPRSSSPSSASPSQPASAKAAWEQHWA